MSTPNRLVDLEARTMTQVAADGQALDRYRRNSRRARGLVAFDPEVGVIYLYSAVFSDGYEVDTDRLTTAAELVDWIYHLRGKLWFSDQHLADFLAVVRESCGDPRTWGKRRGGRRRRRPAGSRFVPYKRRVPPPPPRRWF